MNIIKEGFEKWMVYKAPFKTLVRKYLPLLHDTPRIETFKPFSLILNIFSIYAYFRILRQLNPDFF